MKNQIDLSLGFNLVRTPIFAIDQNYNIVFWNSTLESFSSIKSDNIISKKLYDYFPHLNTNVFNTRVGDLFDGGPPVIFSALLHKYLIPCKLPNGSYRIQHTTVTVYRPQTEGEKIAVFTIKDLTEEANQIQKFKMMRDKALQEVEQRKITEAKLIESEKTLTLANANKDRFFSIIAHDLKSPFIGLLGFTEMMTTDFDDFDHDEIKEMMHEVYNISKNTFALLKNLLDWSRLQTGRMELNTAPLNLKELVNGVVQLLNPNANQKNISITHRIDENILVEADENMLNNVIRNLISNAVKFSNSGDIIQVAAERREGKILISISDNGVGMSQEVVDKLFKIEVNHTEKGTNQEEGTGLGLILCQDLIKKHGSQICVESEAGVGSTFSFSLREIKAI